MKTIREAFGARVRARRKHLRLRSDEVAEAVGRTEAAVYQWETAQSAPPIDLLPPLAAVLKTTVGYFFGEAPLEERPTS